MQSGINYFFNLLSLDSGIFKVYYEFDGTGNAGLTSIKSGNSIYSSSDALFQSGGSGYFSGNAIRIPNETGLFSKDWTMMFVYEKTVKQNAVLFSCYHGETVKSGFAIGINDANRAFFESYAPSGPQVLVADQLNLGVKNALAVTKIGDGVYFSLFDFNSKKIIGQNFYADASSILDSSVWTLGGIQNAPAYFNGNNFRGQMDSFLYFNSPLMPYQLTRMFSGFYANQSGIPNSSKIYSFGMDAVAFLENVNSNDNVEVFTFPQSHNKLNVNQKASFDRTLQEFTLPISIDQNSLNLYINGDFQVGAGYSISGSYYNPVVVLSGGYAVSGKEIISNKFYDVNDELIFDTVTGSRQLISGSGAYNQHLFLNGVKFLSGANYTGLAYSSPIDNDFFAYSSGQKISQRFARGTSQIWLNGIRQSINEQYIEISSLDLLTGTPSVVANSALLINDDNFWNILAKVSLTSDIANEVDSRIANRNATTAKAIFMTQDHANSVYVRNTNCWIYGINDVTCMSPWNSAGGPNLAGTLVTPRHIIFAAHYQIPVGATIRFVDMNNNVVTRTVIETITDPQYAPYYPDIAMGVLDSDVPSNIAFVKLLPSNWQSYISSFSGEPSFGTDQEEKALIEEVNSFGTTLSFSQPTNSQRLSFYENIISGDSGNPVFIIIDGHLVLLTTWTFQGAGAGTNLVNHETMMNQLISSLDTAAGSITNYTVTTIDLSSYGN